MKTTRQKRAAPFYAVAAVWLAYALVLPLYEPLHYALAGGGLRGWRSRRRPPLCRGGARRRGGWQGAAGKGRGAR